MSLIVAHRADALSELYDRYSKFVFGIAMRVIGNQPLAEDITLDVFERVWERASLYDRDHASVSTWLASITHHRAIDMLRRAKARPVEVPADASDDGEMPALATEDSPEELAALLFQRRRVRAALDDLPKEQREVLMLAFFGGLTQKEISDRLAQPLGTVKTRLRLGMQKLKRMLVDETVHE